VCKTRLAIDRKSSESVIRLSDEGSATSRSVLPVIDSKTTTFLKCISLFGLTLTPPLCLQETCSRCFTKLYAALDVGRSISTAAAGCFESLTSFEWSFTSGSSSSSSNRLVDNANNVHANAQAQTAHTMHRSTKIYQSCR
jgi:hypothetical protein